MVPVRDKASVSHVVPFHIFFEMSTNMLCCDQSYLFSHVVTEAWCLNKKFELRF